MAIVISGHLVGPRFRTTSDGQWYAATAPDGAAATAICLTAGLEAARIEMLDAVAALALPGVVPVLRQIEIDSDIWLMLGRAPGPSLGDLMARPGSGFTAGNAATVLNETAQTLLVLHAAGYSHGGLDEHDILIATDGKALLALLGRVGSERSEAADTAAWAGLAARLARDWAGEDIAAGAVLMNAAVAARRSGLADARAVLIAGRPEFPTDFLERTQLRAAVAANTPELTTEAPQPAPDSLAQRTVLGSRHGSGRAAPAPAPVAGETADDAAVRNRFGPGVSDRRGHTAAGWPPSPAEERPRGGRRWHRRAGALLGVAVIAAAAFGWWFWAGRDTVETHAVFVRPHPNLGCDDTADLIAAVYTNGEPGVIRYRWIRAGERPGPVLSERVTRGRDQIDLHLQWQFSGVGTFDAAVRLELLEPTPMTDQTTFVYECAA